MPGASLRGPRLAVLLLAGVLTGGTVGYMVIEGWSAWDAFYMTVTTVATVGYGEVHPLSVGGRVFTVLLIFCGVGTAFYTVTLLATIIVEGGLHQRFEKRRALVCSNRSKITSSCAATDASAASSRPSCISR